LSRSCCFRPRPLMSLLPYGSFQRLILDGRPFGVIGATLSWSYLLRSYPLPLAISARWAISLRATANFFRDPCFSGSEFSWRVSFFAMPLLQLSSRSSQ
jgi:hypothetical protein